MRLSALCLLLPLSAIAGAFRPADLTADARWFVHVDHDAARASAVGSKALGITDDRVCPVPEIKAFADAVGFDGRRDLLSFTAYGTGAERQAVAIIRHRGDNLRIGEYLKSKGGEPDVVDGVPLLGFACGPAACRLNVAFPSAGIVVIAMSPADAARACAALENTAVVAPIPAEFSELAVGSPIVSAACDMVACRSANPRAARLAANVNVAAMAASESAGTLTVNARLAMARPEAAQAGVQMVEGAKAFATSRNEALASWVDTLVATAEGASMSVSWKGDAAAITAEMDKARERMIAWRKSKGGACPVTGR